MAKETILLVEDDELLRVSLRRALEKHDYKVIEASGVAEAWEMSRRENHRVDLLLTDLSLPDGDGLSLASRLTQERPSIKTIFMSASPRDHVIEKGLLQVGQPLLAKPFHIADLLELIRKALAG